jgi:hypothetical protein
MLSRFIPILAEVDMRPIPALGALRAAASFALSAALLFSTGCGGGGGGGGSHHHGARGTSGGGAAPGAAVPPAHPLSAGVATVDITPPVGVPLGGFGEGPRRLDFPDLDPFDWNTLFAESKGVRDPIYAKALVLDDGEDRLAIVTLDLVGCGAQAVDKVFRHLRARGTGIPLENILVCASHTHSGPGTLSPLHFWEIAAMDFYQPQIADEVVNGIARAILEAEAALEPARLGLGTDRLRGITKNRRAGVSPVYTRDSIDDELAVFRIDRTDGSPLATLYNFAIHGLVMWWDNMDYSADIMGDASRYIAAGGGGTALFVNGAEGDINPDVGHGDAACLAGGAVLGQAVLDLRARIATDGDCDIRSVAETYDMGPPHFLLTPQRLGTSLPAALQAVFSFIGQGLMGAIPLGPDFMDHEYRYQAIRIRNAVIASVPGEPIHELGLEIKKEGRNLGFDPVLVFGLANGHGAYYTTEAEYWAGGYEALATLFGPDTGKKVKNECVRMMGLVR